MVDVAARGDDVTLQVTDDGHGIIGHEGAMVTPGVGMRGMRARVMQFGGEFAVKSGPTGTSVQVRLRRVPRACT
jgi:two-component system NarL family sensor kinase